MAVNPSGMTGTPTAGPVMFQPSSTAPTGSAGNMGFGNTTNPTAPQTSTSNNTFQMPPPVSMNPTGSPTASPSTVTGQNGQQLSTSNSFDQTGRQQDRTLQELQSQYGEGMGSMLYQYLQTGGGFNSALTTQAIDAQDTAMQHQITEGFNTLNTNLSESGISPNSSVAALEKSDYMSTATANENSIAAQEFYNMWNSSQNREEGILQSTSNVSATATANQPSVLSEIESGFGLFGAGAQGVSAGMSAMNPSADTGLLDLFGALAI